MDSSVKRWLDDKDLFLKELEKGRFWESQVAMRLSGLGYEVTLPAYMPYNGPNDPKTVGSNDLRVNGLPVEVKSRALEFTGVEDYPYPTIYVKNKKAFDCSKNKPVMVVCVSQKTGEMVGLDVEKTYEKWTARRFFDRVRKIHTTSYECEKELWEELSSLCGRLFRP